MRPIKTNRHVEPCPFACCAAKAEIYIMPDNSNVLFIRIEHGKDCPAGMLHRNTFTIITEQEIERWNLRVGE